MPSTRIQKSYKGVSVGTVCRCRYWYPTDPCRPRRDIRFVRKETFSASSPCHNARVLLPMFGVANG